MGRRIRCCKGCTIEHDSVIEILTSEVGDIAWAYRSWIRLFIAETRSDSDRLQRLHRSAPTDLRQLRQLLQDQVILRISAIIDDKRKFGFENVIGLIDKPKNTHPISQVRPLLVALKSRAAPLETHRHERVAHRSLTLNTQPPPDLKIDDFRECVIACEGICSHIRHSVGMPPVSFDSWGAAQPGEELLFALSAAANWHDCVIHQWKMTAPDLSSWIRATSAAKSP